MPATRRWITYPTGSHEEPLLVTVDASFATRAAAATATTLYQIRLPFTDPALAGYGSHEEAYLLRPLDRALSAALTKLGMHDVGRIRGRGVHEISVYAAPDREAELAVVLDAVFGPLRRRELVVRADPEWSFYRTALLPTPAQRRELYNDEVIRALAARGDELYLPRPVDHVADFKTSDDRDAFVAAAANLGFTHGEPSHDPRAAFPYRVHLRRTEPIDRDTMRRATGTLSDLAATHHGSYDGWSAPVTPG